MNIIGSGDIMNNIVKRSLYYYDLIWREYDDNKKNFKDIKNKDKRFIRFLRKFLLKDDEIINPKYIIKTDKDDQVFIITDEITDEYVKFRLVLCKTNALPLIEQSGKLEELSEIIDDEQNIAEVTHCIYFVNRGILGAEFNFFGARVSAIASYMKKILFDDDGDDKNYAIRFNEKINEKAYEQLSDKKGMTLFKIGYKPDSEAYAKILSHHRVFSGPYNANPEADIIEITIKKRKTKKNNAGLEEILSHEEIKELVNKYRTDLSNFSISQGVYSDCIDLLSDKMVGKVELVRTNRRTIDRMDMYSKIIQFYEDNIDDDE